MQNERRRSQNATDGAFVLTAFAWAWARLVLKPFCSSTGLGVSPAAPRRDNGEGLDLDLQEVRDDVEGVEEQDVQEFLGGLT